SGNISPSTTPRCTAKPTIRRVSWSITTKTQYVRKIADSHRNKSKDHSESFAFPIKESQDGPRDPASGWKCVARIRRTTSLSMSTPNAKAICSAIRLQPQLQLRPFHFKDRVDQFFRRAFGTWPTDSFGGKQHSVLLLDQHFMKMQQSRGF